MTKNQKIYMYVGIAIAIIAVAGYLWYRSKKQNDQQPGAPTPKPGNGNTISDVTNAVGTAAGIPTTSNPAPNTPANQISVTPVTTAVALSGNMANASPLATVAQPPVVSKSIMLPVASISQAAAGPVKMASKI